MALPSFDPERTLQDNEPNCLVVKIAWQPTKFGFVLPKHTRPEYGIILPYCAQRTVVPFFGQPADATIVLNGEAFRLGPQFALARTPLKADVSEKALRNDVSANSIPRIL
jgi:hypothetical protein